MDKVTALLLLSSAEPMCPHRAFRKTCSDTDVHIHDKRVARLLVLLQQLDESAEGLEGLPKSELSEIVSSAIRVCGFADPIEARDVIAIALDAIEMENPIPERVASEGHGMGLSDA